MYSILNFSRSQNHNPHKLAIQIVIGDVLKRLVKQKRPLQSKLSARDRLGLRLRRAQNGPPTGRPRTAERPCPERARWVLPARGAPPPTADRKVPGRRRGW